MTQTLSCETPGNQLSYSGKKNQPSQELLLGGRYPTIHYYNLQGWSKELFQYCLSILRTHCSQSH